MGRPWPCVGRSLRRFEPSMVREGDEPVRILWFVEGSTGDRDLSPHLTSAWRTGRAVGWSGPWSRSFSFGGLETHFVPELCFEPWRVGADPDRTAAAGSTRKNSTSGSGSFPGIEERAAGKRKISRGSCGSVRIAALAPTAQPSQKPGASHQDFRRTTTSAEGAIQGTASA